MHLVARTKVQRLLHHQRPARNDRLSLLDFSNNLFGYLFHTIFLLNLDRRYDDAKLFVGEVSKAEHVLGPAIVNLTNLMEIDFSSLTSAPSEDLSLPSIILLLQHRVGAPDHAHTGTTTSLDTRD